MTLRNLTLIPAFFVLALSASAATLVNINTADLTTLETLNGIGPSKGQAIIDYRTQHGAFASIDQIMNVSGIGTATYNGFKDFITVGDAAQTQSDSSSQTQTQTQASSTPVVVQTQTTGGLGPPPITAQITTDTVAVAGAGSTFAGAAFGTQGQPLGNARFIWNFGDGTTREGAHVVHTFAYPGAYDIELSVAYDYSSATARAVVSAVAADVSLIAEGDGSLTVNNYFAGDLDIGLWSIAQGTSTYTLPEGTVVLEGKGVRFAPAVLGFAGTQTAQLRYPNGQPAAQSGVGQNSPLRGQVVDIATPQNSSKKSSGLLSSPQPGSAGQTSSQISAAPKKGVEQVAAVGAAPAQDEVGWSYLVGLVAVIAIGAVGTYYAYIPRPLAETGLSADEFDIE